MGVVLMMGVVVLVLVLLVVVMVVVMVVVWTADHHLDIEAEKEKHGSLD